MPCALRHENIPMFFPTAVMRAVHDALLECDPSCQIVSQTLRPARQKKVINRRTIDGNRVRYFMRRICDCNNNEVLQGVFVTGVEDVQEPQLRQWAALHLKKLRADLYASMRRHEMGLE